MKRRLILFVILIGFVIYGVVAINSGYTAGNEIVDVERDLQDIFLYRKGMTSLLDYMRARKDLYPEKTQTEARVLTPDKKTQALFAWKTCLDYYIALDEMRLRYGDVLNRKGGNSHKESFYMSWLILLTEYRFALEFIEIVNNDPLYDVVYNEALSDFGLPQGMYAKFKYEYLNVIKASEFASFDVMSATYGVWENEDGVKAINADREVIWKAGGSNGPVMTVQNGVKIIADLGKQTWLPIQKGLATIMGKTKVHRRGIYWITDEDVESFYELLEPGDILLERREWHMTNIGIPGYWTHAALFVGTAKMRDDYFSDSETKSWTNKYGAKTFEKLLKKKFKGTYKESKKDDEDGYKKQVIEALAPGVMLNSLESSAHCDSLAIIRPRISKKEKAIAIYRAYESLGKPYDYDFNFQTDAEYVCSELIFKCYQESNEMKGLALPLENRVGHLVTAPNALVELFDKEWGTDSQQFDLVVFLDGSEKKKKAEKSTVEEFRKSWRRPKWHIFVQE